MVYEKNTFCCGIWRRKRRLSPEKRGFSGENQRFSLKGYLPPKNYLNILIVAQFYAESNGDTFRSLVTFEEYVGERTKKILKVKKVEFLIEKEKSLGYIF